MAMLGRNLRVSARTARHYTGFVGAGNMGAGMALNIAKAGNQVKLFDLNRTLLRQACEQHPNISAADNLTALAAGADVCVVSVGRHPTPVWNSDRHAGGWRGCRAGGAGGRSDACRRGRNHIAQLRNQLRIVQPRTARAR